MTLLTLKILFQGLDKSKELVLEHRSLPHLYNELKQFKIERMVSLKI